MPLVESGQACDCLGQKNIMEVMLCTSEARSQKTWSFYSPETPGKKSYYPGATILEGSCSGALADSPSVTAICLLL